MSHNSTFSYLNENFAASRYIHVDETKGLWNAPVIEIKAQIAILSFEVLGQLVFNPFKSESFLEGLSPEDIATTLHLEQKLHIIASNCILELFL